MYHIELCCIRYTVVNMDVRVGRNGKNRLVRYRKHSGVLPTTREDFLDVSVIGGYAKIAIDRPLDETLNHSAG
jgi:hypothetical protein